MSRLSSDFDDHRVELKLMNGTTVVRRLNYQNVYNLAEHTYHKWSLGGKFPWIHCKSMPFIKFRYKQYANTTSYDDSLYAVNYSLGTFLHMLGVPYQPWAESMLVSSVAGVS